MRRKPKVYIGTSGWSYNHWKKNFYPEKLAQRNWLPFYAKTFPSVEINMTFYRTPLASTIEKWDQDVPKTFRFSIKASRYITHLKRMNDCEESLDYFYSSIEGLKRKTGPILFQFPPSFQMNLERLEEFLLLLKKEYRYTFEFRHKSWFVQEIYDILAKYNISLCLTDLNGKLSPEVITSDFIYIRLHGPKRAYKGSYGSVKLKNWKNKIEGWIELSMDVYCYFDNDEKGYAIEDAKYLQDLF